MWDLNGVAVVLRQRRQSCEGVVFTLFDHPSCVVVVKNACVTVDHCRLLCGGFC